MKTIKTPISKHFIDDLLVGDIVYLSGQIYTGRDAVLPKLLSLIDKGELCTLDIDLEGCAIFHTAVSPAGVGPTSSNKLEIENSIPGLSRAGVKLHLGKGALKQTTVESLREHRSVFATVPPVTALLDSKIISKRIVAFPEEGMEALHQLEVEDFPIIISAIHGEALFL